METTQRDRIIEQAMQMFVAQGIKSVRMDDIATRLGVSKRTLYEMFADKEELLYLALICYFEQQREQCDKRSAGTADVLEAMFLELDDMMDRAVVTNRMMDNLSKFYPAVHAKLMQEGQRKNREGFRKMLERGIADGLFIADFNIDLAISVLYYTATALVMRRELMLPEGISEHDAFTQIISTFFRGISTTEGVRLIDAYRASHLKRKIIKR